MNYIYIIIPFFCAKYNCFSYDSEHKAAFICVKRYSYSAVKLFITQCVFAIFGLTLSIATGKSRPLQIAACIGAVIFYLFMVYSDCFKLGAEDRIRVGGGRETAKPQKGLYIGLAANSPNLLLCFVGMLTLAPEGTFAFRAGTVAHTVHLFLQGAWTGIAARRLRSFRLRPVGYPVLEALHTGKS